ncbi:MAG: GNAT family N-acetyltransferase, partial [Planctomycetota bacterium]
MPTLDPLQVARFEEARQALTISELARESEPVAGGRMSFEAPGSWASRGVNLGIGHNVELSEVDRIIDFYTSRGCEPTVELCSFVDESLLDALQERAFTLHRFGTLLARPLDPAEDPRALLPSALPQGPPATIRIRQADPENEADVDAAVRLSVEGFVPPETTPPDDFIQLMRRAVQHPRSTILFGERDDGDIIAMAGLEEAEHTVALFGAVVTSGWRRRGMQTWLLAERLHRAASMGKQYATIESRPGM